MLFTLLGVKHLPFAPLGFLSFFLLAGSLRLFKEDFIKKLVAVQALVWKRSIAHNVPSKMGWWGLFAFRIQWRGTLRQSIVNLTNSIICAAICFLYSAIPERFSYYALQSSFFFFFLFAENLSRTSKEPLQSITIPTIWKSFIKKKDFFFQHQTNALRAPLQPALMRFSPPPLLVTVTVLGAVGFKVILKGL